MAWTMTRCPVSPVWACVRRWKTTDDSCWRCTACEWPEALGRQGAYGRCVKVELLHKLHDERKYPTLEALREGIQRDIADAQAWFAAAATR